MTSRAGRSRPGTLPQPEAVADADDPDGDGGGGRRAAAGGRLPAVGAAWAAAAPRLWARRGRGRARAAAPPAAPAAAAVNGPRCGGSLREGARAGMTEPEMPPM